MIEAVVWDIGMVLVEWHPERYYDGLMGEERRRAFFAETDPHGMNKGIDLGQHSRDAAYAHAEKHPRWADEVRRWHDNWIEMLTPDVPGSAHLLRAVKAKGVPCFALSNFGADTLETAKGVYPQLTLFDAEFVSGHLGVVKPDAGIYEALEDGTGVAPEQLLFADDSKPNVEAALARGWKAHHFTGPEGWAARLVAEGVLTEEEARF